MTTTVTDVLYRTRELWKHRGPPKEVFEDAGDWTKMLRKNVEGDWVGSDGTASVPVRSKRSGNVGSAYERVFGAHTANGGQRYKVPAREMWETEQFDWFFLRTQKAAGIVDTVDGKISEMAQRVKGYWKAFSYYMWSDGTGRLAKGDGSYSVAGTVITLLNKSQVNRFEVDDIIVLIDAAAAVPASGQPTPRNTAGVPNTLTVTARDETAGTITVSAAVNTIAGAVNTDYIGKSVDFENPTDDTSRGVPDGLFRWCPITQTEAVTDWASVTRSSDPDRLARQGISLSGSETPWNICMKIMQKAKQRGKPVDAIWVPTSELTALHQELRSDQVQQTVTVIPPKPRALIVGLQAIEVQYAGLPPCKLLSDIYLSDPNATVENDKTYVGMRSADWQVKGTEAGIGWVSEGTDGSQLQVTGKQKVVMSYGDFFNLFSDAPGNTIVASPRAGL